MSETKVIKSACRMCHGVCQVNVHLEGEKVVKITGDPESPTSRGYICPKGMASPELLYHPDRLTSPLRRVGKRGGNRWERVTWDEALNEIVQKFSAIRDTYGPEYVGLLHGTSRPYVDFAERLANAFGTPNFTNVAHICMGARVLANVFSAGNAQFTQPDVYGFGGVTPECIMLWGTNITELGAVHGLCGHVVKQALKKARKVIVVDPRRIAPAKQATHWLQVRPGTDGALALAMIHVIIQEDLIDHAFVDAYTVGYQELKAHIFEYTPEWAERITRVKAADIRAAARTYATTPPASLLWGNAIDMSASSFHTARALMILRAITGNIDRPGGDAIWVTPQQVRMKSQFVNSEMSGKLWLPLEQRHRILDGTRADKPLPPLRRMLFPLLSCMIRRFYHRIIQRTSTRPMGAQLKILNALKSSTYPLCPVVHPPTFWKSILTGEPYRLKALWIVGSNPLATMTNPLMIEQALPLLEFIVVSDSGLRGEAGVSYLLKTDAITILFDVGLNAKQSTPSPLLQNMETLRVNLEEIDAIVISHNHLDHVGGFTWQRQKSFSLTRTQIDLGQKRVYTPVPMTCPGSEPICSRQPTVIADGVALTGTIPGHLFLLGAVEEQALAVNVQGKGLVLIVGCGHQTLFKLLHWVEQVFDEPLHGIIGGLHYPVTDGNTKILGIPIQKHIGTGKLPWQSITTEEMYANIQLLQQYAPQMVGLSPHDSCKVSIEAFRQAFGNAFRDIIVGKTISIGC